MPVKNIFEKVNIWRRYEHKFAAYFFGPPWRCRTVDSTGVKNQTFVAVVDVIVIHIFKSLKISAYCQITALFRTIL